MLTFPFRRGGFCQQARAAGSTRVRARDLKGTAKGIAFEPRKIIADKYRRHREILPRLRGIDSSFSKLPELRGSLSNSRSRLCYAEPCTGHGLGCALVT